MSFPRYPEYKDSGIEWLGEVPAHWDVERLKHSVDSCRNGIWGEEPADDSNDLPCVRVADFDRPRLRVVLDNPTMRSVKPSERKGRVLKRGDLVLEKSGGGEKQPVGFVVLYDDDRPAVCSNFTAKMELSEGMNPSFWRYVHAAAYSIRLNVPSIKQTSGIQNLDQQSYLDERAAYPPSAEQAHIATFLDRETARIDALVEEQQRLIEVLKEKRQAVISHAVTKGLDPDVTMKDSGVEWLGEVPAYWEVAPLKYLAKEKVAGPYGASLTKAMYTTSGYRVYGQQQVIPNDFSLGDYYISQEKFEEMSRYQVFPGDVLFSVMGTVGKVAVVPSEVEPGIINPRLVRYRFFRKANPDFLRLLVMSQHYQDSLQESAQGSTMEGLNMSILGDLPILLPDPEEQSNIVARLKQENSLFEELVSQVKHAMNLLIERRSALISAAVTGKIDVRGWKSGQYPEQPEVLMAAEERATYA